jgi:hypothetical protein
MDRDVPAGEIRGTRAGWRPVIRYLDGARSTVAEEPAGSYEPDRPALPGPL